MPLVLGVAFAVAAIGAFIIGTRAVPGVPGLVLGVALMAIVVVVTRLILR